MVSTNICTMPKATKTNGKSNSDEILRKLYYDSGKPTAYAGANQLIRAARDKGITRSTVLEWLSDQDAYTLHKKTVRRFRTRRYTLLGIDDLWQADLADMRNLAADNDGYRFWLIVIDTFSKFVWLRLLKNKSATTVLSAMQEIVRSGERKPKNLNTDKGTEFCNRWFREWAEEANINFYTAHNPDTKACFAERVIRTLKERVYRHFTHTNTQRYIDAIQDIVKSYNSTKHSATGYAPLDVNRDSEDEVRVRLNPPKRLGRPRYKADSTVRIMKESKTFRKGYTPGWTDEMFEIVTAYKTDPPTYQLRDLSGELITGRYYEPELQIVKRKDVYRIDRVLRRRRRNNRDEVFVSWLGYPLSMASWIPAESIQTTKES
jgi:transposase InsO family protein